jgi:hypothetical protein
MGSPPKRYFRLNLCKIANIFLDKKIEGNMRVSLKLKCGKPTIRSAENTQLLHIYNKSKDMKEDKKEEYIAPPFGDAKKISSSSFSSSSPHSSEQEKLVRQPQVEVTNDEHKKLIEKFGEDFVKEGYIELSDWKNSASPHQVKKHKSDYYRLRKWVIPGLIDQNSKLNESKIAKHRRGSPLVTPGDYDEDNFRRVRI